MNTNNAPERMSEAIRDVVRKCMQHQENFIAAYLHQNPSAKIEDFTLVQQNTGDGYKFWLEPRAAMQPQVSESNEAVAREICKTPCVKYGDGQYGFVYADVLSVLKRHRQPAAVSADAVELAHAIKDKVRYIGEGQRHFFVDEAVALAQAYGDACRLDGYKKGLADGIKQAQNKTAS